MAVSSALDPDGRRVTLDERGWSHIRRRHADLARSLRDIMATVREPYAQLPGRSDDETWFFSEHSGPRPWLQVVVHYEGGEGWIATAFARKALPRK